MAQPIDFRGANDTIDVEIDRVVQPIGVYSGRDPHQPFTVVCWALSAKDRAEIDRDGKIWLAISGAHRPAMLIGSEDTVRAELAAHNRTWPKLNGGGGL